VAHLGEERRKAGGDDRLEVEPGAIAGADRDRSGRAPIPVR